MKVTICGSVFFIKKMEETKRELEKFGHEVKMPPREIPDESGRPIPVLEYYALRKTSPSSESWVWEAKAEAMRAHISKIIWAEAVLVENYLKNEVPGYIGANTFGEMLVAFYLGLYIFLREPIPEMPYCQEEIIGMHPIVIGQDLTLVRW